MKSAIASHPFAQPQARPTRGLSLTCKARSGRKSPPAPSQKRTELPEIDSSTALLGSAGLLTPVLLDVQNALAQKGEYGIVEGRIASLTHPALMFFLFGASVYTGWLGFQWRCELHFTMKCLSRFGFSSTYKSDVKKHDLVLL